MLELHQLFKEYMVEPVDRQFQEAALEWDLETLYTDLASAKGKHLTPVEKANLRGLLCGFSPSEIAEKRGKEEKGISTDLCATLYKYVKTLLDRSEGKINNWRNITDWLDDAGYKAPMKAQVALENLAPDKITINVTDVTIHQNQVLFVINLKLPTRDALGLTE
jgi:hypothetical protein